MRVGCFTCGTRVYCHESRTRFSSRASEQELELSIDFPVPPPPPQKKRGGGGVKKKKINHIAVLLYVLLIFLFHPGQAFS